MKTKKTGKCDLGLEPIYQYDLPGGDDACGYCAMSAVYRYYGLDPERLTVEALLGTQKTLPYNFPGRDTIESFFSKLGWGFRGTWPFDALAVLHWHGFETELVSKNEDGVKDKIKEHLQSGHPIFVLGWHFSHWLAISGFDGNKLIITDSTKSENVKESYDSFIGGECDGLIFVSRSKKAKIRRMTTADFAKQYARGTQFCLQVAGAKMGDIFSLGGDKGTWAGNQINNLFGYEEGTVVGNFINRIFG